MLYSVYDMRVSSPFESALRFGKVGIEGQKNGNAYDTRGSQAVTPPSTNRARRCLTSVIRREPVFSTWYGRKRQRPAKEPFSTNTRANQKGHPSLSRPLA